MSNVRRAILPHCARVILWEKIFIFEAGLDDNRNNAPSGHLPGQYPETAQVEQIQFYVDGETGAEAIHSHARGYCNFVPSIRITMI